MKKVLLSITLVLSVLIAFTSCKKENSNSKNNTFPIQYKMEAFLLSTTRKMVFNDIPKLTMRTNSLQKASSLTILQVILTGLNSKLK